MNETKNIFIMKKLCCILLLIMFAGCGQPERDYKAIHNKALVADLHSDTPLRMKRGFDFSMRDTSGCMDIPRLQEGGVDLQVFACFIDTDTPIDSCRLKIDELIDTLDAQISRNQDKIEICRTAGEAERIIQNGKIAAFIGIENGVAIANHLDNLQHFYDRGVRYMTLTHTASNDWCISSADTAPAFSGLTDFGREVVREMNRLGMIIDISHAAPSTVDEVLKITSDPVIASHSCVHSICEHDRNLTDEQIKAIAKNGGMIGINFYTDYLSSECNRMTDSIWDTHQEEIDSLKELYKEDRSGRYKAMQYIFDEIESAIALLDINVGTLVNHIDYVVNLVGADYVGLGSDYDGVWWYPEGLEDCSMLSNITEELVNRGYTKKDIEKILGGNFMRVFRQVCEK